MEPNGWKNEEDERGLGDGAERQPRREDRKTDRVRKALVITALLANIAVFVAPVAAHDEGGPLGSGLPLGDPPDGTGKAGSAHRLEEIGFHPLFNDGYNADVWPQVVGDRLFAYVGSYGESVTCMSTEHAADGGSIKIVDVTDPRHPVMTATQIIPVGRPVDVKVTNLETPAFSGEVLVAGQESICGMAFIPEVTAIAGVPVATAPFAGFELFDVINPRDPTPLGVYRSGGIGVHNLFPFSRPDLGGRAFVALAYNETVEDTQVRFANGEPFLRGILQIVEITDPLMPTLVATWSLEDDPTTRCDVRGSTVKSGYRECYAHDVWVAEDGKTAYVSWWDAGVIVLDISDPAVLAAEELVRNPQRQKPKPRLVRQWQPLGEVGNLHVTKDGREMDHEGNLHTTVPFTVGSRTLLAICNEDYDAEQGQGFLRIVDPTTWEQINAFKTANVDNPPDGGWYSCHNPIQGPDGRLYISWTGEGVRVLSIRGNGRTIKEEAWFVPGIDDHPDDQDTNPNSPGFFPDNAGFWGSLPVFHPDPKAYDLHPARPLILNSDINRGLYILYENG